uniref:Uncharacterized protein n=1 Tax=Apteryx owenii TaxID=8824 RepID=A0A8B9NXG1_APTOW
CLRIRSLHTKYGGSVRTEEVISAAEMQRLFGQCGAGGQTREKVVCAQKDTNPEKILEVRRKDTKNTLKTLKVPSVGTVKRWEIGLSLKGRQQR